MAYQASKDWAPNTKRVITPTVIQMEAVECGAAALGIILAYYGQFVPLEELRVDCGVSRDGSKASSIVLAARNRGLDAQGFRYELEQLGEVKVPFIVFWNFNHFLVVEGFSKDKVFLNDPATGPRTVSLEEFDQCFTGIVLTFETTPAFSPSGKAPSVVLSLKKRLKNNYDSILFLLLIGIILVIPGLLIPTFTKIFIDDYLVGSMSNWLGPIIFGLMITGLAKGALVWMQNYYLLRFETKLDLRDSSSYFWHILHLPMAFFSQRGTGDLSSRILLNSKIASSLSRDVSRSFLNMFVASFYLLLMFLYTPTLTACTLILAVINFLVLKKIIKIQHDKSLQMGISLGKFQSIAYNGLDSMETLKASGRENDYFNKLMGIQVKIINAYQELQDKVTSIRTTPLLLNGINTTILLGLGSILIIKGYMSIGMLMAFQILADGFLAPISDLVAITGVIQGLSGDMAKVDDVMKAKALPKESPPDTDLVVQKFEGYLSLENISFGYNVTQKPLIQGFSLTIKPGQRIALIGGSGSGKSTIAKLISRLYSPWEGSIKIDDRLITDIAMIEYAGSVSFVDQEIRLFKGSIADNIRMWDSSITEEDMIQAAKDACIHQDITQRDKAYNTEVSQRGANFSGGQCQRIEIARALAKNPRVLIMDEATSALDPITEEIISNNIRHRGCTCIIIAHRLSTIKDCDEIIVLSQGEVVERGTHQELIKHSGHYSQLIKMEASS